MIIVLHRMDRVEKRVSGAIKMFDDSILLSNNPVVSLIRRLMLSTVLEQGAWLHGYMTFGIALAFPQQRCRCFSMNTRLFISGMCRRRWRRGLTRRASWGDDHFTCGLSWFVPHIHDLVVEGIDSSDFLKAEVPPLQLALLNGRNRRISYSGLSMMGTSQVSLLSLLLSIVKSRRFS